jgi:hypothetical protein
MIDIVLGFIIAIISLIIAKYYNHISNKNNKDDKDDKDVRDLSFVGHSEAKRSLETITIKGNILCHITLIDEYDKIIVEDLLRELSIPCIYIGDKKLDDFIEIPSVIIGNPIIDNIRYVIACPHIFLKKSMTALIDSYMKNNTDQKLLGEFLKSTVITSDLYHTYQWADIEHLKALIVTSFIPQMKIKLESIIDGIEIIHISGPMSAGKTSLMNQLIIEGIKCIDTDDITDNITCEDMTEYNRIAYEKIAKYIHDGVYVFVGLTIPLSIIATHRYCINTLPTEVYKRLLNRSITSICENVDDIKSTMCADDIDILDKEFDNLSVKHRIRFPGFIKPSTVINNDIRVFLANAAEMQYQMMSSDDILADIIQMMSK